MAAEVFGAVLRVTDNVSGALRQAALSSRRFEGQVARARSELQRLDRQRIRARELRIRNSAAFRAIQSVQNRLRPFGNVMVNLRARTEHAMSRLSSVRNAINRVKNNKIVKVVVKGVSKALGAISKLTAAGAAAGMAAVSAAGALAVKKAVDFESQMSNVSTLLDGDVSAKVKKMGEQVKNISLDTGIDTDNLTSGLYEVVSAFGESADSTKQLEIAAKAAKAGNAETADSVRMLSAVTKGYGDTSADAVQKAADLAFMTVKLGQTSFPELASSMGSVVPLASTLKVSQEELFGAMSTLTGVTGNTAEVSTQLKATLQGFMSPTADMSKALKDLGYANGAAALESEGLDSILKKLKTSVKGDEVAFAGLFSSVEAKNAVLALAGSQAENFTNKTKAMHEASGAADEAFKRQTGNVAGMANKIKNAGMVMLINIGEKALPVISKALDTLNNNMPSITSAITEIFTQLQPIFDKFTAGFSAVMSNLSTIFTSILPVIVSTFTIVSDVIETVTPIIMDIFNALLSVAVAVFPTIQKIVAGLSEKFSAAMSVVGEHTGLIENLISNAGPVISAVFEGLWSIVGPILDLIISTVGVLMSAFETAFPAISAAVKVAWDIIKPILDGIGGLIKTVADALKSLTGSTDGIANKSHEINQKVSFNNGDTIQAHANGTRYFSGGLTTVAEHGKELISLPTGSKIYSNSDTNKMLRNQSENVWQNKSSQPLQLPKPDINILNNDSKPKAGSSVNVNISSVVIREEADIDKIAMQIVRELDKVDR